MDTHPTPTTLDEVRLAIFQQHSRLAQLIDELEEHANAVRATGGDGKALSGALGLLHSRFLSHLEYEEKHLTDWLPEPEGDTRDALLGDHDEQRARMKGLVHDRAVFGDPRTLAAEVMAFVHFLRKDMSAEDAKLRALG